MSTTTKQLERLRFLTRLEQGLPVDWTLLPEDWNIRLELAMDRAQELFGFNATQDDLDKISGEFTLPLVLLRVTYNRDLQDFLSWCDMCDRISNGEVVDADKIRKI